MDDRHRPRPERDGADHERHDDDAVETREVSDDDLERTTGGIRMGQPGGPTSDYEKL